MPVAKHTPGQIPEYILVRKAQQQQQEMREEQERARRALVPDGFKLVSDDERASAERKTRDLWQEAMGRFMRIPHDTATPVQVHRRQELEKTIQTLENQLRVLSVEGGGALLVPEGFSLMPQPFKGKERPMTEGERIKMLQSGPSIL